MEPACSRFTYSLTTAPAGMVIDSVTGLIQWTPSYGSAGDHEVEVKVQNSLGEMDTQSFTIDVADVN